jgi:hypothetical protein
MEVQNFLEGRNRVIKCCLDLERDSLSLVRITEVILEREVAAPF